jgi:hypothetical protein
MTPTQPNPKEISIEAFEESMKVYENFLKVPLPPFMQSLFAEKSVSHSNLSSIRRMGDNT